MYECKCGDIKRKFINDVLNELICPKRQCEVTKSTSSVWGAL